MARYKLENALRGTEPREFESDKEAWNTLRETWQRDGNIVGVFIWLWKEIKIIVPINDEENFVNEYNAKYGPKPIGYGGEDAKLMEVGEPNVTSIWVPILIGLTTDEYKVKN